MRHTYKGAAALAALCAGALAFTPAASAACPVKADSIPGASGADASVGRIAGIDRIQTSLQASTAKKGEIQKFFIAGYGSQVDALTLSPWNCKESNGFTIFVKDKLEKRHQEVLAQNPNAEIYLIGGEKSVPNSVMEDLEALQEKGIISSSSIIRVGGVDRFDTAYQVGGFILEACNDATGVSDANLDLADARKVIDNHAKAQEAFEKALAEFKKAQKDLDAAVEAKAKALDKLFEEAAKHIDVAELQTQFDEADKAYKGSLAALDKKLSLYHAVIDDVAITEFSLPNKDENSVTLQDFKDAAKDEKQLAAVEKLTKLVDAKDGFTWEMKLNEAIKMAKDNIKAGEETKANYLMKVGELYSALQARIDAEANNAKITKSIADANAAYLAAAKKADGAQAAFDKADEELTTAINKLSLALGLKLDAERIWDRLVEAYQEALKAAYAASVKPIFVTTGTVFADALAAGPAAFQQDGLVLLTDGAKVPAITKMALDTSKAQTVAIGGLAARAMGVTDSQSAAAVYGADRYATAVEVAKRYFTNAPVEGAAPAENKLFVLASGEVSADAVAAGTYLSSLGKQKAGSILLTKANMLPTVTEDFLSYGTTGQDQTCPYVAGLAVFGGKNTISKSVVEEATDAANLR